MLSILLYFSQLLHAWDIAKRNQEESMRKRMLFATTGVA